jgi:carboxypeptidase PM20D1
MKTRIAAALLGILVVVVIVVAVRTQRLVATAVPVTPAAPLNLDTVGIASRLAAALRFPTISYLEPGRLDGAAFAGLRAFLETSYPLAHTALDREIIGGHSLLYTWSGTQSELAPVLLLSHMDVVPVEEGTLAEWTHPPFAGVVADGFVWGRGALDNKAGVLGILEAVELLLAEGHRPRRTVLLAFGHDEEAGGFTGARAMATLLQERGVRPALVLDEGGFITQGVMPGIDVPVALIGVAEKGYLSLELLARGDGGHSSMPPAQTAVGVLARAVDRLQSKPFPARLDGVPRDMFAQLAPAMSLGPRAAVANLWLSRALLERQLLAAPSTAAMLRTTTAPTMFEGSPKDNVLPIHARAVVNFRIRPGESVASVSARVRRVIDDERVAVRAIEPFLVEPSPTSPSDGAAFEMLRRTILQVQPDALVAPYLLMAATDARHYTGIADNVYRFLPLRVTPDDVHRVHGTDERIQIDDYARVVRFFRQLLLTLEPGIDFEALPAAP